MDDKVTIPASKELKLIIENSYLKQILLERMISDLKINTQVAIDNEAKTFGFDIESFNMDDMTFQVKTSK